MQDQAIQIPFRQGSRQRKRQSGTTQSLAGGANALAAVANFTLDKVGMLNYLLIRVQATVTLSAAGAFATNGPWSVVDRIRVDLNLSNMNLYDCDGRMSYDISRSMQRGFALDGGGNFTPLTLATVELHQCYFSSLDPRAVILPLGQVVRTVQTTLPVVATGGNLYTVERQGKLMSTLTRFVANGVRSDSVDRLQIIANINDTMYDETAPFNAAEFERDYSIPKPVGIFYKDFWHAREDPSMGDGRDLVNLEVLTTFQQNLQVSSGAVLGSGNNFYDIGRRILVNFVSPATTGINPLSE